MSSKIKINPWDSILSDIDFSHESDESLIELCTSLAEMHARVYGELQERKLQALHSFVEGMMRTSNNEDK